MRLQEFIPFKQPRQKDAHYRKSAANNHVRFTIISTISHKVELQRKRYDEQRAYEYRLIGRYYKSTNTPPGERQRPN
jgi:hypothetical protein